MNAGRNVLLCNEMLILIFFFPICASINLT